MKNYMQVKLEFEFCKREVDDFFKYYDKHLYLCLLDEQHLRKPLSNGENGDYFWRIYENAIFSFRVDPEKSNTFISCDKFDNEIVITCRLDDDELEFALEIDKHNDPDEVYNDVLRKMLLFYNIEYTGEISLLFKEFSIGLEYMSLDDPDAKIIKYHYFRRN